MAEYNAEDIEQTKENLDRYAGEIGIINREVDFNDLGKRLAITEFVRKNCHPLYYIACNRAGLNEDSMDLFDSYGCYLSNIISVIVEFDPNRSNGMSFSNFFIRWMSFKIRDEAKKHPTEARFRDEEDRDGRLWDVNNTFQYEDDMNHDFQSAADENWDDIIDRAMAADNDRETERAFEKLMLEYCSNIIRVLNGIRRNKGIVFRMFYTEMLMHIAENDQEALLGFRHNRDIWASRDEFMLGQLYTVKPNSFTDLRQNSLRLLRELAECLEKDSSCLNKIKAAYKEIYNKPSIDDKLDKTIEVPIKNPVYLGLIFLREYYIIKLEEIKVRTDGYISQYRNEFSDMLIDSMPSQLKDSARYALKGLSWKA